MVTSTNNAPNKLLEDLLLEQFSTMLDPNTVKEKAVWKPNVGPQTEAFYCEADELFFGGAAGGGKAVVIGSLILTPFGWKKAEEIKTGDTLIAHDDGHTKVLAVYPHKDKDLYKFTFFDGASVTVSDDHLWMYWYAGKTIKDKREYILYSPEKGVHVEEVHGRLGLSKDLYKLVTNGALLCIPSADIHQDGYQSQKTIRSIEYVGKGDGVCFAIDHPSGLHVVQDYIVTHNSDLMLGLALSELSPHRKAIIFRRSYPELKDIVTRANEILEGSGAKFKGGTAMRFSGLENKSLELGSVPDWKAAQKYKGRPHDLKLFDEVSDISEAIYTFLIGWARTAEPGVPVRVVAAGNPPTHADGQWVIRRWAAWLDPTHPNPAKPSELRYYATLDGIDTELTPEKYPEGAKGEEFEFTNKRGDVEQIRPKSRTFIPAKLSDNPFLASTDYAMVLGNMPEPYRSQLLYGDFGVTFKTDPYQVIPTQWVLESEKLWQDMYDSGEMDKITNITPAFGIDVAEGGADQTTICGMNDNVVRFVDYVMVDESVEFRIPQLQADFIIEKIGVNKRAPIGVDAIGIGIGVGSLLYGKNLNVYAIKVSRASKAVDETGQFRFLNLRAELWWRLRERLNPNNPNRILLPPNQRLRAEITSPRFERTPNDKIKIESTDSIREKIGRSPDLANALLLAMYAQKRSKDPLRMVF